MTRAHASRNGRGGARGAARDAAALALCLACLALASPALAGRLRVEYTDGRPGGIVETNKIDGFDYVAANDLARLYEATKYWRADTRKLVLKIGERRVRLTVDSWVVVLDQTSYQLLHAVRMERGIVYVPVDLLTEILSGEVDPPVSLQGDRIVFDVGKATITKLVFVGEEPPAEGAAGAAPAVPPPAPKAGEEIVTEALLLTSEVLEYKVEAKDRGHIRLEIPGGRLDPGSVSAAERHGMVLSVGAKQLPGLAVVDFFLASDADDYQVKRQRDPVGILVRVRGKAAPPEPIASAPGAGTPGAAAKPPALAQLDDRRGAPAADRGSEDRAHGAIRTIVVDPGHGGKDAGRIGPTGFLEKDANLLVARKLRDELRKTLGVNVYMTRDDDTFLPLGDRTEFANKKGADLFVSVHCNGWFKPDVGGFETYFLSPAKTDEARALAAMENSSIRFETDGKKPKSDVEFVLWDMAQNEHLNESSLLAEMVLEEMKKGFPDMESRGVKQAGFYVLNGAFMPAILVEVAFISNKDEERALRSGQFQEGVAQAITRAVGRFKRSYEGRMKS